MKLITRSIVNTTMPPGSTHFDHITEFARSAQPPFAVKSLSEKLKDMRFVRGKVYWGHAERVIANLMENYPSLRWWVEAEGLVIEEISVVLGDISEFDRTTGELVQAHWKDGSLSKASLLTIAEKLDEAGFTLKENLQPAQWKPVGLHNRNNPRKAIRTFRAAAGHPRFARSVRRRLYLSRERYKSALYTAEPIEKDWF